MAILDTYTGVTAALSMDRVIVGAYGGTKYDTVTGVSSLNDQTGNARHFVQATTGAQPAVSTAGPQGRACAAFDGSNDVLVGPTITNLITNTNGYIVSVFILKVANTNNGGGFSDQNDSLFSNAYIGLHFNSVNSMIGLHVDGGQILSTIPNVPFNGPVLVVEWKHTGGFLSIRMNGNSWTTPVASGNTNTLVTNALKLGASQFGGIFTEVNLFEFITFNAIPSGAEQDALVADQIAHFGGAAYVQKMLATAVYQQTNASEFFDAAFVNKMIATVAYQQTNAGEFFDAQNVNKILATAVYKMPPFVIDGVNLKVNSPLMVPGKFDLAVKSTDSLAAVQNEAISVYVLQTGAPALHAPDATKTSASTADLSVFTTGTTGTIYWVITTSKVQPTYAQIIAGQDHASAAAPDAGSIAVGSAGEKLDSATGLGAGDYWVHFHHVAADGKISNVVTVNTFNVAPTDIAWAGTHEIGENAVVGTQVGGLLTATEPSAQNVVFSVFNSSQFGVGNAGNTVIVTGLLDYETATSHNLTIRASDGDKIYEEVFPVTVLNQADISYLNTGGQGDRTGIITVTGTVSVGGGSFSNLVNGSVADDVVGSMWGGAGQTAVYIRFDFGVGASKVITEFKWNQHAFADLGIWRFEGSNDASAWTQLGGTFTLGPNAGENTVTAPSANNTGYRYYQLYHVSTAYGVSPWQREITFKIGDA